MIDTDTNTRQANTRTQSGYVAPWSWKANKVRKTDASGNPAWRDDATGWSTYTLPQATNSVLWWVKLWSDTKQNVAANAVSSTANRTYAIQTNSAGQLVVNVPRTSQHNETTSSSLRTTTTKNTYDIDGQTKNRTVLTPNVNNAYSWLYFTNSFYHQSGFLFYTNQDNEYLRSASKILFDSKGIRINDWLRLFNWAWLSAGWAIVVWNSSTDNYIYMYATGGYLSSGKHFEIMGKQELAVGIIDGAYLYFKNYQDNNTNYTRNRIWINMDEPMATLDINWSIRVNTNKNPCIPTVCNEDNRWTILYKWDSFYWCTNNGWKRFSMENWQPNFNSSCATVEPIAPITDQL